MAKRVSANTLNASTIKILNTIRANAPLEYQNSVPKVEKSTDIPKVGEVIYGNPSLANVFISELINRIALVRIKSDVFNNPYSHLKKGFLEYGETIEEVFVQIAKVQAFDIEKADVRRNKRTLPDVKTAFHSINWRVQYPITVQDEDLRAAFLNAEGVQNLINSIIESVYQAAEYDEFLLFKYILIKTITKGKMYPVSIGDGTDLKKVVSNFRAISNKITFRNRDFNPSNVLSATPRNKQCIFMDSTFNAENDVNVLASAFNMEKAEFYGKLHLIDSFDTFDNERWAQIRNESDSVEEVTQEELNLMKGVKAVLVDEDFFQIYDNLMKFTQDYIGSGMYWNYWLNIYKTVSTSPFSNAIVFALDSKIEALPETLTGTITQKLKSRDGGVVVLTMDESTKLNTGNVNFIQTDDAVKVGIAVSPYGLITYPKKGGTFTPKIEVEGVTYTASVGIDISTAELDSKVTFNKG